MSETFHGNWFDTINEQTSPIFNAICDHNFIQQLTQGTLPKSIFEFYIHQDTLYLSVYKKLLAVLGSKCDDDDECQFFFDSATGVLEVEQALHLTYSEVNDADALSPTCELYTSYLAKSVYSQSLAVGIAAILPCFTIYKAVGDFILSQPQIEGNPYQDWINTYGGEEFAQSTAKAVAIANRHASIADEATLKKMNTAFIKASKLEWMFWDSAFNKEEWVI